MTSGNPQYRPEGQQMNQMTSIKAQVAELGAQFNPDIAAATRALYAPLIAPPSEAIRSDYDIAYGEHPRQTLDVYSTGGHTPRPVLLFVPGGGFVRGDKRPDEIFYGNLARWFASKGFVVITMNYRLAPDHAWPSGAEDVGSALAWIAANISRHGGDPRNILLFGQSAGATHVSTFLYHPRLFTPITGIRGAVLASGLYQMTEDHRAPNLLAYFGTDAAQYADRSPVTHIANNKVPVLLTVAEFDPAFLAAPTYLLAGAMTRRDGKSPEVAWLKGHNHVSTVFSFGTDDESFGRRIVDFAGRLVV
jgi:acetyl esterase/lipase